MIEDEEGVTLKLPVLTALQLYYDGVLSADPQKSIELAIAARKLGAFYLQWLRGLPGDEFGNPVLLRFERKPSRKAQPYDANAWLTGLVPLELRQQGEWDPAEEYWGETGETGEAAHALNIRTAARAGSGRQEPVGPPPASNESSRP